MKNKELKDLCSFVISDLPEYVKYYKAGKKELIGLFAGEVMKRSRGQADPEQIVIHLIELLNP